MKTNISTLMNIISEEEKKLTNVLYTIKGHVKNTSIIELDGRENIIEDYKKDFDLELKQIEEINKKLIKLKSVLYEKNNSFKLSDGRTIQEAIVENTNLRKIKSTYESLLSNKSTKSRISESHDAYFESRTINFDPEVLTNKITELDKKIQETDFEISKLNSKDFTIEM